MHHLASTRHILGIDKKGIASSFHLEKESALYKSSFVAPRTVLTSFDINSLWHKMPFSQRCHVFSFLLWPCWWCRRWWCNVSQLSHHHCRLLMLHRQNGYGLLCFCSRPSNPTCGGLMLGQFCPGRRVFSGFITALTLASPTLALIETYKCQHRHEGPSSLHARQSVVEVKRLITVGPVCRPPINLSPIPISSPKGESLL